MSRLFAAIYDPFMRKSEESCLQDWRHALLASLEGRVLEIGAGTGANLAHYPTSLERLVLTDHDKDMLKRLSRRLDESGRDKTKVDVVVSESDTLPFADQSFDTVVSTLVLCSVPDVAQTLREVHRVLRPGGTLVFLEHVAAEDNPKRLRWQKRIEPFWAPISGNCHLTRTTARSIEDAGFAIESITKDSMRKSLPIVRATIRGVARSHA